MSFCDRCFEGVRHEGTPTGSVESINGIATYVASPPEGITTTKAILFLTDVFGLALQNNLLLADDFARNGFKVYMPDLFDGDPVPVNAFEPGGPPFDRERFHAAHSFPITTERVRAVLEALPAQGITRVGATGYCYGARLVFDFAFLGKIDAAVVTHPSALEVADLEKYASTTTPLLINSCDVDKPFPKEKQEAADELLKDFKPGYKRAHWAGCTHGFAVRGDMNIPEVKAGKEGAFKEAVDWFNTYL
ncbi:Alpha/Beta hydrolase protein [Amylostereum chailletii]|nr:Alpha/Beta hydrolase protein [Amylostereum chailletii]